MADKNVWEKFYPQDWLGDEGLQMCSLTARGLWMEMLCIMWSNGGYFKIGETPLDETHLTRKVGADIDQVRSLLQELESFGVFSRTRTGVIYSRRIVKQKKNARKNRENGKKGGYPKHRKNKGNSDLGAKNSTETDSQNIVPETRSQKPDKEKNTKKESYWYAGKVIKLNKPDYQSWLVMYGGTDGQFMDWLTSRDDWYQGQPPEIQRRWFMSTANYLMKIKDTA